MWASVPRAVRGTPCPLSAPLPPNDEAVIRACLRRWEAVEILKIVTRQADSPHPLIREFGTDGVCPLGAPCPETLVRVPRISNGLLIARELSLKLLLEPVQLAVVLPFGLEVDQLIPELDQKVDLLIQRAAGFELRLPRADQCELVLVED